MKILQIVNIQNALHSIANYVLETLEVSESVSAWVKLYAEVHVDDAADE